MHISLSLWSVDQARVAAEVRRFDPLVTSYHVDVADGRFAENLLFGPMMVEVLDRLTDKPIIVHLMVDEPHRWVFPFVDAGADVIAFHPSARSDIAATVAMVHRAGAAAGMAVKLDEPHEPALEHLKLFAELFVMATPIGVKGHAFEGSAVERVQSFVAARADNAAPAIFVDGGIRWSSVGPIAAAGADGVVAGSILAATEDPAYAAAEIQRL
ncbi:MAG: hypothetical protein ACR2GH_13960 [Pseudonocardia sp.]